MRPEGQEVKAIGPEEESPIAVSWITVRGSDRRLAEKEITAVCGNRDEPDPRSRFWFFKILRTAASVLPFPFHLAMFGWCE